MFGLCNKPDYFWQPYCSNNLNTVIIRTMITDISVIILCASGIRYTTPEGPDPWWGPTPVQSAIVDSQLNIEKQYDCKNPKLLLTPCKHSVQMNNILLLFYAAWRDIRIIHYIVLIFFIICTKGPKVLRILLSSYKFI